MDKICNNSKLLADLSNLYFPSGGTNPNSNGNSLYTDYENYFGSSMYGHFPTVMPDVETGCNHEWKEYVGFTHAFKYCVKCDAKEDKSK